MAVSSDHGNMYDVHPKEKQPIGERLARLALNGTYNKTHITPCGPAPTKATAKGKRITLYFDHAKGLSTADGETPRTFEIAEAEGLFYPAQATIVDDHIILETKNVKRPTRIRYGWQPYTTANLINSDSLPTSTFEININN